MASTLDLGTNNTCSEYPPKIKRFNYTISRNQDFDTILQEIDHSEARLGILLTNCHYRHRRIVFRNSWALTDYRPTYCEPPILGSPNTGSPKYWGAPILGAPNTVGPQYWELPILGAPILEAQKWAPNTGGAQNGEPPILGGGQYWGPPILGAPSTGGPNTGEPNTGSRRYSEFPLLGAPKTGGGSTGGPPYWEPAILGSPQYWEPPIHGSPNTGGPKSGGREGNTGIPQHLRELRDRCAARRMECPGTPP